MTPPDSSGSGNVVVAGSFTAEPVQGVVRYWSDRLGWPSRCIFAPYGQIHQQLLMADSTLSTGAATRALLVSWDDLAGTDLETGSVGWLDAVRAAATELAGALVAAADRSPGHWIVVLARSARDAVDREGVDDALAKIEADFSRAVTSNAGVRVFDDASINRLYPVADWADPVAGRAGHVPYTPEYYAALGTVVARGAYAVTHSQRKVLVLDCDNTLWGGVVGEDGVGGVHMGAPFSGVQSAASRLADEGKLICLASKNREADVRAVFEERADDMLLPWSRVVAHRVNWDSKVDNLVSIAKELDLGLDSFVFVDDNPIECAEVGARLPEVLTIRFPVENGAGAGVLDHIWPLDAARVTAEDRARGDMYKAEALRGRARESVTTIEGFLETLELSIDVARVSDADVPRASQLTQRTNQFNSTTLRRSESDIRSFLTDPDRDCLRTRVSDRFGDYGTVGLTTSRIDGGALTVDGFMLSCRALARGVEYAMLRSLGDAALDRGLDTIDLSFEPSERNEPLARFFGRLAEQADVDWAGGPKLTVPSAFAADAHPSASLADQVSAPERSVRSRTVSDGATHDVLAEAALRLRGPEEILRAARAHLRGPRPELSGGFAAPRSETERLLADLWGEVLHLDRVGRDDLFSDLGGTSLDLVVLLGRIAATTGRTLDITVLLEHATVRALAGHMDGSRGGSRVEGARDRAARQREAMAAVARRSGDARRGGDA